MPQSPEDLEKVQVPESEFNPSALTTKILTLELENVIDSNENQIEELNVEC